MLVPPESPSAVLVMMIDEQQVCVYLQPFSRQTSQ